MEIYELNFFLKRNTRKTLNWLIADNLFFQMNKIMIFYEVDHLTEMKRIQPSENNLRSWKSSAFAKVFPLV